MKKLVFIFIFCLLQVMIICAQVGSSGKVPVLMNNKPKPVIRQDQPPVFEPNSRVLTAGNSELSIGGGKFYALIIGISNYSDPLINELDKPLKDAELFYNTLTTRYTFEKENVKFLRNATMADMIDALDYFAKLVSPIDNFLIFYAGHGVWDASSEIGFWLPSDARKSSKLAWFRNSTLRDYLREIKSKHTLLISDACFGGSIFKTRSAFTDAPPAINILYELPSRRAMTSGTLTEVPIRALF